MLNNPSVYGQIGMDVFFLKCVTAESLSLKKKSLLSKIENK
jgi:hypothetical protein